MCVFPLLGWEPWGQGPDPILLWVWRLLWAVSGPVQRQVGNFSLGLRLGAFPPCEALSSPCQGGRHFPSLVWGPAPQYLTPRCLFVSLIYLVHSLTAWNRPLHLGNVGVLSGKALAAALCLNPSRNSVPFTHWMPAAPHLQAYENQSVSRHCHVPSGGAKPPLVETHHAGMFGHFVHHGVYPYCPLPQPPRTGTGTWEALTRY